MNRPLVVILAAVTLDAVGIGLIFPILPRAARCRPSQRRRALLGIMLALYSACQFLFSPILGVLSDRFGRRPVLLVSLAGAAIDYLIMAFAPELWMLVLGRAISGITSANMAVATAYITDISSEEERAKRFGLFHAMFGIGFIIGPVLGGVLGDYWVRAPFIAAALLNGTQLRPGAVRAARIAPGRARRPVRPRHAQPVQAAQMGADLRGADSADGHLRHHELRRHHVRHHVGAVRRGRLPVERLDDRPVAGRASASSMPARRPSSPVRPSPGWASAGR